MKKEKKDLARKCPYCGGMENQVSNGKNRSGSQQCFCKPCKKYYTLDPKPREIPQETRQLAIKMLLGGMSGRKVGEVLGFNHQNAYNWLKKTR